ncbi:hypothetical protein HMPREF1548_03700 [Clostridium sp. KLE 1755]|nr:hypothetical protein HMPREF1548_03700 [Clostridium sp. KLE 1755]
MHTFLTFCCRRAALKSVGNRRFPRRPEGTPPLFLLPKGSFKISGKIPFPANHADRFFYPT